MNIERTAIVERHTAGTFIAGFAIILQVFAVDGFGQNTGTGGFAHTPWTTKQKGMRQRVVADRIF